jgi:hypothetical protein
VYRAISQAPLARLRKSSTIALLSRVAMLEPSSPSPPAKKSESAGHFWSQSRCLPAVGARLIRPTMDGGYALRRSATMAARTASSGLEVPMILTRRKAEPSGAEADRGDRR